MSGFEAFDYENFIRGVGEDASRAAAVDAGVLEYLLDAAEGQKQFLNALGTEFFPHDVRDDLGYMGRFLEMHPGSTLEDLCIGFYGLIDRLDGADPDAADAVDAERLKFITYQKAERTVIVLKAAGMRQYGSDETKADFQAEIFAFEHMADDEAKLWAAEIDALLPGEGLDILDPDEISVAVALHGIKKSIEHSKLAERRMIRDALGDQLDALYAQHRVPIHEDLAGLTRGIASVISWEPDSGANPLGPRLNELRDKAAAMGWTPSTFDRFVEDLRGFKRLIISAINE